jgi:hypothetical protein
LADDLIPIVKRRTIRAFAAAFALKDYEEVVPEWIRVKWRHRYYLCMFHIANLLRINRDSLHLPAGEKVAFVFGHKPKYIGLLTELYDEMRLSTDIGDVLGKMDPYGEPAEDIPVQAADLFCYLTRVFWEHEFVKPKSAPYRVQKMLMAILGHPDKPLEPHFLTRPMLEGFARAYTETHQEIGDWAWNSQKRGK